MTSYFCINTGLEVVRDKHLCLFADIILTESTYTIIFIFALNDVGNGIANFLRNRIWILVDGLR